MYLITGAAGFIGSGIVRALNDQGRADLLLVDDLGADHRWKNLVGKSFVDLIPKATLFDWLSEHGREVDAILHLGACSDTVETNADFLLENNTRYTLRLADWALQHKKRFIYASSAATYGDGKFGFADDEASLEKLRPINMYAYSKHLVDLSLKRQGHLNRVVGLKYFNVFGPNEYHKGKMASMVLKMAKIAQNDGAIQLYRSNDPRFADGDQCRDFLYVKDAVAMTLRFLSKEGLKHNGIYNIGSGKTTTWNQLAHALFAALGRKSRIEYIDMPPELLRQYQNYTCASMTKFPQALPPTPIGEAVRDYVTNYLIPEAAW